MSSSKDHTPPCGNPYEILSIPITATASQIKKAFRDLSLQLHPDKRHQSQSKQTHEELDRRFMLVKDARSFLLDDEYASQKKKYDAQLAGVARRRDQEAKREATMNERRKRMRDDLERKLRREEEAASGSVAMDKREHLDTAGKRRRETVAERWADADAQYSTFQRKKRLQEVERRQIRLKWSRTKVSLSRAGINKLLSDQFGRVEEVELIGKKGNAALVTFASAESCKPCVNAYQKSEEMRASFVGKRKDEETNDPKYSNSDSFADMKESLWKDRESVEERKLRLAAERESLLRRMEDEEERKNGGTNEAEPTSNQSYIKATDTVNNSSSFPPNFPPREDGEERKLTVLQKLEESEYLILKDLLTSTMLKGIRITSS